MSKKCYQSVGNRIASSYLHKYNLDLSHLFFFPMWNAPENGMRTPHTSLSGGFVRQPRVAEARLWFSHNKIESGLLNQCLSFKEKYEKINDIWALLMRVHNTANGLLTYMTSKSVRNQKKQSRKYLAAVFYSFTPCFKEQKYSCTSGSGISEKTKLTSVW